MTYIDMNRILLYEYHFTTGLNVGENAEKLSKYVYCQNYGFPTRLVFTMHGENEVKFN